MTDLEALLRPVSDDAHCGPDLDAAGDPAYVELGVAAEWKEAKYVGDQEVAPAQQPDWRRVKETGAALLAVSKDLRIAKHYVAALAYTEGLPGFAAGVRLLRDLLDRYWDALHPVLESPDDDWRKNLVTEINAERGALGGLRAAAFAESRKVGRYTVRDIEVLDGAAAAAEGAAAPTAELLREAIRDTELAAENLRLESCREALADLKAIQGIFRERQGALYPEFPVAEKLLARAQAILSDALGFESAAEGAPAPGADAEGGGDGGPGKLKTRADARRVLESVCDFLERTEPAHPAPILIRRAARLLDLSFVDIIRDLAPEAAGTIENLGGIRREST
ncbi:MAG TPA: type VI secretion system protein TssA [Burkholderiales bacterium]|jgi:type VI secretion system protein ImpA